MKIYVDMYVYILEYNYASDCYKELINLCS